MSMRYVHLCVGGYRAKCKRISCLKVRQSRALVTTIQ